MVTIYVKSCKEQHVLCRLRASVFDVIPARKIKNDAGSAVAAGRQTAEGYWVNIAGLSCRWRRKLA